MAGPVLARPCQTEEVRGLDSEVQRVRQLVRLASASERPLLLEQLVPLERGLEQLFQVYAEAERNPRRIHLACYKLNAARAEFSQESDVRLRWMEIALRHAHLADAAEPLAGAYVLHATLLKDGAQAEEAAAVLEQCLREVEAPLTRPYALYALAEIHMSLGHYAQALERLDETLAAAPEGPNWERFGWRVPGTRGQVYLDMGLPDVASEFLEEEYSRTRELRALETEWMAWSSDIVAADIHRANLLYMRGQYDVAARFAEERAADEELYATRADYHSVLRSIAGRALAQLERHDPTRPRRAESILLGLLDTLPAADSGVVQLALADLELARGALALAGERLVRMRTSREAQPPSEVVRVIGYEDVVLAILEARLELGRGAERDTLRRCRERLASAWQERLALWAMTPPRAGGAAFLRLPVRREALSELVRLDIALDGAGAGAERALETILATQAQGSIVRAAGLATLSLDAVREALLASDRGAALWLPAVDRSHLFLLERERVWHVELERDELLETALDDYHSTGRGPAQARRLLDAVLPSAAREVIGAWRGITLLDDLLGRIPLELLPRADGKVWGTELAIDHLPSLPLGWMLARRASARASTRTLDLYLVAAPIPAASVRERWAEVGPLALNASDLQPLVASYVLDQVATVSAAAATPSALFDRERFARTRVLQVLAHSVADYALERPTALVLSPETGAPSGLLGCSEVEDSALEDAPPLVLLTSCRSGRGPRRPGDEATGHMGGAWLRRGADTVLLADHDLDLDDALALSRELHRGLARGASPAEALRAARRALESAGRLEGTAGLYLLGLGHRPIFPERGRRADDAPAPPARDRRLLLAGGVLATASLGLLAVATLSSLRRRGRGTRHP